MLANKKRNIILLIAIVLTTVMLTTLFTVGSSIMKSMEISTTYQVGTSYHAGFKFLTQEEYDEGHIPGAVVISHEEIAEKAEEVLTDKDQLILVYCRSGRRSKIAAEALAELGYTNIKEFGGILDWPYEVEKP